MSGFLLDTNILSELVRPLPDSRIVAWLAAQALESLFISAVSFGELRKGIELREPGKRRTELEAWLRDDLSPRFTGRVLPLTREISERWGILAAQRQRAGRPLNGPDGMIAATAIEHSLALVTRNVKDFEALGLTIIDPWNAPAPSAGPPI